MLSNPFKGFELSDVRILNLLVERRLQNYRLGYRTPTIARILGLDLGETKSALRFLHGKGWVEQLKRARIRWRATFKAICWSGFAEGLQKKLEDFI